MSKKHSAAPAGRAAADFRFHPIAAAVKAGQARSLTWASKAFIAAAAFGALTQPALAATSTAGDCVADGNSTACGAGSEVTPGVNTALGASNSATGGNATAVGVSNTAAALYSLALGSGNTVAATGIYDKTPGDGGTTEHRNNRSLAIGFGNAVDIVNIDSGAADHSGTAIGQQNVVAGEQSVAVGERNKAYAQHSSAFGVQNTTYGKGSVALGLSNTVGVAGQETENSHFRQTAVGVSNTAAGVSATALGLGNLAMGDHSFAAGSSSVANGDETVVIGRIARADGMQAVAIGTAARAIGDHNIAIGAGAMPGNNSATVTDAIAIGRGAITSATNSSGSIAIGQAASISSNAENSVALGQNASASQVNAVALGPNSRGDRANSVAVGSGTAQRQIIHVAAGTQATDAVNVSQLKGVTDAFGGGAKVDGTTGAVTGPTYVIGGTNYTTVEAALQAAAAGGGGGNLLVDASKNTWSSNAVAPVAGVTNSVALGDAALANEGNDNSTAIGSGAQATGTGNGSIALGRGALAQGAGVAVKDIQNETTDSAGVTSVGNPLLASGDAVSTDTGTTFTATSIGRDAAVLGAGSVGIGNNAVVTGSRSVAVGAYSAASGFRSTALSDHAFAQGDLSIAIGSDSVDNGVVGAHAIGEHSIAIGADTKATADRSVVIGLNATADTEGSVALGTNSLADRVNSVAVGRSGAGNQRQIIHVAAGTADTDAVNVSQLKGVTGLIGGGAAVDPVTGAVSTSITVDGSSYNSLTEAIEAAAGSGGALAVEYTDATKAEVALGGVGGTLISNVAAGTVAAGSMEAVNGGQLHDVRSGMGLQLATSLGGGASYDAATGALTAPQYGITAGSGAGDFDNVGGAIGAVDTALNELGSELAAIGDSAVQYDDAGKTQITLGGAGATEPTLITNLKAGAVDASSSDAVNGSQLYGVSNGIAVDVLGGGAVVNPDGTITGPTYNIQKGSQTTIAGAFDAVDDELTVLNGKVDGVLDDALLWDSGLNAYSALRGGVAQKITGVANGAVAADSTDAINGSQLHGSNQAVVNALGGGSSLNPDGTINGPTYNVAGGTQTDVGGALTAIDSRITDEIAGLGNAAVQYDDPASKDTVTFGGASGTTLNNVAAGELSETSTDAVNGSQLHATNLQVTQNTADIANLDNRVTNVEGDIVDLGNQITDLGTEVDLQIGGINTAIDDLASGKNGYCRRGAGDDSVECGEGADASIAADNAVAIGSNSAAHGIGGVAIGNQALAESAGSVAIGDGAFAKSSVAVGMGAQATGLNTTAIGDNAQATGDFSVALGNAATATAANSVALGNGSIADRDNAVSVGATGAERQIINVEAGVQSTDAVNVSQLKSLQASSVSYDLNPDGSVNYNRVTFGRDPNGDIGGPVTLGNVADAVAPTDAVNLRQLNAMGDSFAKWLDEVERDANAGIAAAVAMEAAPYLPGHITYALGSGYHVNEAAVGLTLRGTAENGRWSLSAGVAGSQAGTTVRFGVSGVLW